jgi:hypothetical protein
MPVTKKLFYFYLPLADNEGRPFSPRMFTEVADELNARFGGTTRARPARTAAFLGEWSEPTTGEVYRDEVIFYLVLADAVPETEEFFVAFHQTLKERFQQKAIFLIAHLVEVY